MRGEDVEVGGGGGLARAKLAFLGCAFFCLVVVRAWAGVLAVNGAFAATALMDLWVWR